ncbi:MAG: hypothetical protein SVZ03_00715 [Spirochaetota bacterium]|nr:hypothetical protein [Spirochaetota bacterium]
MNRSSKKKLKVLVVYFSRTGNTERLAKSIGSQLKKRGCDVAFDEIKPAVLYSWIREVSRDFPRYPAIGLALFIPFWRRFFLRHYHQVEEDIQPMEYPNISEFDRICVGGPKWAIFSYPVARYLQTVRGIMNKRIGIFATFGGPPLKVFEVELLDRPMTALINRLGSEVIARVFISSGYHEAGIMPIFRIVSRMRFSQPIENFMLGSEYANEGIKTFCDDLMK